MKLYKYNHSKLKFYNIPFIKVYLIPIITVSLLLIYSSIITINYINNNKEMEELSNKVIQLNEEKNELFGIIELLNDSDEFSEENLFLILEGLNVLYPHIAIAQSKLETNNWKSDIFLESGNLFGMKAARIRPHTHYGELRGHADYKGNWKLSVIDYALWQAREARNVKSEKQYLFLLEKLYAEDPEYITKINKIISNN